MKKLSAIKSVNKNIKTYSNDGVEKHKSIESAFFLAMKDNSIKVISFSRHGIQRRYIRTGDTNWKEEFLLAI